MWRGARTCAAIDWAAASGALSKDAVRPLVFARRRTTTQQSSAGPSAAAKDRVEGVAPTTESVADATNLSTCEGAGDVGNNVASSSSLGKTTHDAAGTPVATDPEPERWLQSEYVDPDAAPLIDEKGEFIVSRVKWPTGEVAYRTPPPPDKLAPRFGYNVLQVKKEESWWQHYRKHPRISVAYINIQVLFLLGVAWLMAFLSNEHRRMTEEMRRPGAMVGDYRGKGPSTSRTQKVSFSANEMNDLMDRAQSNWLDATSESNYIGSKNYQMKRIPRPAEFTIDEIRKR